MSALEGVAQDIAKEACASLEDGAPTGGLPNTNRVVSETPTVETTIGLLLQTRQPKLRLSDRLMLGLYVKSMEWSRDRTRPEYPPHISRVVPPSEVPLYNP